ncbi:MAG: hypothetical protein AAGH46_04610 [Bacteroidota bacterium]
MKNQEQKRNVTLELLKTPLYVFIIVLGSPFFVVHKLVHWASVKAENKGKSTQIAVS